MPITHSFISQKQDGADASVVRPSDWNAEHLIDPEDLEGIQGPPGDKGPSGDQGPIGDQGPVGDKGLDGDKGPGGDAGEQGPVGDKGPTGDKGLGGDQGPPGVQGDEGFMGDAGPDGDKGPEGDQGEQGYQGIPGEQGADGDKGATGDAGATGDKGPTGDKGATGDQGSPGLGAVTCKQTSSVQNNSNTTPSDIPGLTFSLTADHRYYFKFMLTYQTAATTTGIGFVFTSPAMTAANWKVEIRQAAAGTDQMYTNSATTLTTVLVSASVIAATTDYIASIEGFCQPSAGGTLQLQCRSEVNGSQVTVQNTGIGILVDAG